MEHVLHVHRGGGRRKRKIADFSDSHWERRWTNTNLQYMLLPDPKKDRISFRPPIFV